ncbi:MAG: RNA polymerase factor sigma-54 [Alphaproteobacteria bacterium]|nr:RNA polymerase factor sigma-54 [Alphaproteobacteria bacterium]
MSPPVPRLEIKTSQSLTMTAGLRQAIGLLQLSNQELDAYLTKELEQNPFLEREDIDDDRPETDEETYGDWQEEVGNMDIRKSASDDDDAALAYLNNLPDTRKSLREHIQEQINIDLKTQAQQIIAADLLAALEPTGYLACDINEVAKRLGCPKKQVQQVLDVLQTFSPAGIFARSLKECMLIQLREAGLLTQPFNIMLDNLEVLARGDISKLKNLCKVDEDEIRRMIACIRKLNPKPAVGFDFQDLAPVIADVIVRQYGSQFKVELNQATLPRLLINNTYVAQISSCSAEQKFVTDRIKSANWLIKALNQRAQTILKVAAAIVQQQNDFLLLGVDHLKPMALKDVAQIIHMHESTVSRVTSNKYMQTPRGLFELKYFFSGSVNNEDVAANAIKHLIKQMIATETEVLPDDRLAGMLSQKGTPIARRTVAKYREAMGIPSSAMRKRSRKLKAGMRGKADS